MEREEAVGMEGHEARVQEVDGPHRALRGFLAGTLVLNLIDLVLTLGVVLTGLAIEANPLLTDLLERSPVAFGLTKILLVSLGVGLIWMHRSKPLAFFAGGTCFAAYGMVAMVHMRGVLVAAAY